MSIVKAKVWFKGTVTVEVETDDYPHYFENDEARGGVEQLVKDVFYDEASLRGRPFQDGSSEFEDAFFDLPADVEIRRQR